MNFKENSNVQNRSPAAPASAFFSCLVRISHSQFGYSESSFATGSSLFFKKFRPFNGVPAGTELFTVGWAFSFAGASFREAGAVAGSSGVAEVDVAPGVVDEDVGGAV
jgi:hypothetical protein